MVEISRLGYGIAIKGHANYAPHGQDIVCASISVLFQTLVEAIDTLTLDYIEYHVEPGDARIVFKREPTRESQLLVDSFLIGFENIAEQYPKYVRMISPWA